jgi:hypothetical protein
MLSMIPGNVVENCGSIDYNQDILNLKSHHCQARKSSLPNAKHAFDSIACFYLSFIVSGILWLDLITLFIMLKILQKYILYLGCGNGELKRNHHKLR